MGTDTALVYTIRRTNLSSHALYAYTVHRADCVYAKKATTHSDFENIPNLKIKIAVGTVTACKRCQPDLIPLRTVQPAS